MTIPIASLILAVVQPGHDVIAPLPVVALPPHSVPPAAIQAPPPVVRDPHELRPAQSYVTPDDYPVEALGTRAQGTVRFTLTVGPDGHVIGCTITRSSGSAMLDAATCRIMTGRGRYAPATDSNGNPAVGTIAQEVDWKVP